MNNNLNGIFEVDAILEGELTPVGQSIEGEISAQVVPHEYYTGEYDIIPKAYQDQVLPTADKIMTKNVTVYKVPYSEAHNESGTTVYIAKEANYDG